MPTTPPLNLTQVEIRPFTNETVTNRFSCGQTPIDRFLKNKAKQCERRLECCTFCAHIADSPVCIGYYTLQVGGDSVSELLGAKQSYVKNYVAFPAIHLLWVGVHEEYQRQGLGQHLLMDAFSKVAEISKNVGFYALTLQSIDENSTAFYESLGFEIYSENLKQPKMLYPLQDILELVLGEAPCGDG